MEPHRGERTLRSEGPAGPPRGCWAATDESEGDNVDATRQLRTELWEAYRTDGAEWARDDLLAEHAALVHREAMKLHRRGASALELGDLVGAGMVGLMEAVAGFDPDRGLAFSTFALPRVRGAMIDHMRQWDVLSRSARRRERQLTAARRELGGELGRAATRAEVGARLDLDDATLGRWELDAARGVTLSLDGPATLEDDGGRSLDEVIPAGDGEEVVDAMSREEELALLREALAELPERERTVLGLYYLEGLTLREVGELLGVTESRISQIRTAVLGRLRERLGYLQAA